jgi:hypothetical protein
MSANTGSIRESVKVVHGWEQALPLLEQWRRNLTEVKVELKRPRVIDPILIDTASGETVEMEGTTRFGGQVIYITDADVTVRRPMGAMHVLGREEIAAMSDGTNRFEL